MLKFANICLILHPSSADLTFRLVFKTQLSRQHGGRARDIIETFLRPSLKYFNRLRVTLFILHLSCQPPCLRRVAYVREDFL